MLIGGSTKTDAAASEWSIDDFVMRVRLWASDMIRALPPPPTDEWLVGSGENCALRLDDPTGRISRVHARLVRENGRWVMRDMGSPFTRRSTRAWGPRSWARGCRLRAT